jgi:hypothetical protein
VVANEKDWRFNHYNLIDRMISWSHRIGSTATKLSHDNSGRRYDQVLDEICNKKCSENFSVTCKLNTFLFSCPIDGKEYPLAKKREENPASKLTKK